MSSRRSLAVCSTIKVSFLHKYQRCFLEIIIQSQSVKIISIDRLTCCGSFSVRFKRSWCRLQISAKNRKIVLHKPGNITDEFISYQKQVDCDQFKFDKNSNFANIYDTVNKSYTYKYFTIIVIVILVNGIFKANSSKNPFNIH